MARQCALSRNHHSANICIWLGSVGYLEATTLPVSVYGQAVWVIQKPPHCLYLYMARQCGLSRSHHTACICIWLGSVGYLEATTLPVSVYGQAVCVIQKPPLCQYLYMARQCALSRSHHTACICIWLGSVGYLEATTLPVSVYGQAVWVIQKPPHCLYLYMARQCGLSRSHHTACICIWLGSVRYLEATTLPVSVYGQAVWVIQKPPHCQSLYMARQCGLSRSHHTACICIWLGSVGYLEATTLPVSVYGQAVCVIQKPPHCQYLYMARQCGLSRSHHTASICIWLGSVGYLETTTLPVSVYGQAVWVIQKPPHCLYLYMARQCGLSRSHHTACICIWLGSVGYLEATTLPVSVYGQAVWVIQKPPHCQYLYMARQCALSRSHHSASICIWLGSVGYLEATTLPVSVYGQAVWVIQKPPHCLYLYMARQCGLFRSHHTASICIWLGSVGYLDTASICIWLGIQKPPHCLYLYMARQCGLSRSHHTASICIWLGSVGYLEATTLPVSVYGQAVWVIQKPPHCLYLYMARQCGLSRSHHTACICIWLGSVGYLEATTLPVSVYGQAVWVIQKPPHCLYLYMARQCGLSRQCALSRSHHTACICIWLGSVGYLEATTLPVSVYGQAVWVIQKPPHCQYLYMARQCGLSRSHHTACICVCVCT